MIHKGFYFYTTFGTDPLDKKEAGTKVLASISACQTSESF
nr:MAG TPA: hypothetical protein [Caudoviricetes sp.]